MRLKLSSMLALAALAAAACVAHVCVASARAVQSAWPTGQVIETVACEADATQTYTLYLPSAYSKDKRWPILYAFDPSGRGRVPVNLLREAAERYGYVVVGSNNSRNGVSAQQLNTIINVLWKDTRKRISIDDRRIYAAGFSGGARVANRLASSCGGCVAGVISCGAGFPPDIRPDASLPYFFYGTVGWNDFNFRELRALDRTLDSLGVAHRVEPFDAAHQWGTKDVLEEAVAWLEVQAMRTGRRAKDDALAAAAEARLAARLERLNASADAYERYRVLRALATGLKGLRDVTRYETEAESLSKSKELRDAVAGEERQIEEQRRAAAELTSLGAGLLDASKRAETLSKLRVGVEGLQKRADAEADTPARRVARRTLAHVYAETYESALYNYVPRGQYAVAAANLELASLIYPRNAYTEYELARMLALDHRGEEALDALSRAVGKGFNDKGALEREEAFAPLRPLEKFRKLLERIDASEKRPG